MATTHDPDMTQLSMSHHNTLAAGIEPGDLCMLTLAGLGPGSREGSPAPLLTANVVV